jgi:UDP-GlcNAc3NAcA epimerase
MHIVSVVGARPQFVKLFPISRLIRAAGYKETIIHTGQHYDRNMSDLFFEELKLSQPEYNLGVGSSSFSGQVSKMIVLLEEAFAELKPDLVLNYGDTNTTLATAISASRAGIMQAHIEAGLRSGVKSMPEEQNRIVADHLSNILFAPTPTAVENLKSEGITEDVHLVGDVMVDSLTIALPLAHQRSKIISALRIKPKGYSLLTVHRAENTENPETFLNIFEAIREIGEMVIFPVHPRSKRRMKQWGIFSKVPQNLKLIEPVGYLDMLVLEENARVIMTDSGGIQKEALLVGTPCLTLRTVTEWVETIEVGANILVGTDKTKMIEGYNKMKGKTNFPIPACFRLHASELIVEHLISLKSRHPKSQKM